jgi:hypothetical protein
MALLDSSTASEIPGVWVDNTVLKLWLVVEETKVCVKEPSIVELIKGISVVLKDDPLVVITEGLVAPRYVVPKTIVEETVPFPIAK